MYLLPQPRSQWRQPSQRKAVDGIEDQTRFRITGRLDDGHIVWRGWFDERDDADAFLYALACGSLIYERELWELPQPAWHPELVPDASYDFATVVFLTASPGTNQTYTSPSDWNNANNTIEAIGGGATGAAQITTGNDGTGGGGGQYAKITNFSFAAPGTTTATYNVGNGGAKLTAQANGNPGTVTYFNAAADPGAGSTNAQCSAKPGFGGVFGVTPQSGGAGGTGGWGQTLNNGGAGGNITGGANNSATGGGGAAGPNGAGNAGVSTSSNTTGTNGGSGDAGSGGAAGTAASPIGGTGGAGTEWDASHGAGGGGGAGGVHIQTNVSGGAGGLYGGGSGSLIGLSISASNTATGGQGIIVITYTPPPPFSGRRPLGVYLRR